MEKDIQSADDTKHLVNSFCSKVRNDGLLGEIFNYIIRDKWPEHLEKMYRFRETVLPEQLTYSGSPFPPHAKLPVSQQHFDRWLLQFDGTVDKILRAKSRRSKVAGCADG